MAKNLHLEPIGGISGDMMLGLLVDLGASLDKIQETLQSIEEIPKLLVQKTYEKRHQIGGVKISIQPQTLPQESKNYLQITQLLQSSIQNKRALKLALAIFQQLAEAEAKVHQCNINNVHFHEVGAWDSIADIVGVAIALDELDISQITVSAIPVGTGFVQTAHGTMPIPAPATLELLCGLEIVYDDLAFERVTPTGAAILKALATPLQANQKMTPSRIGIGLGTKNPDAVPNILRGSLCHHFEQNLGKLEWLECAEINIDDSLPEWLGYTQERLLEAGACDVIFLHAQMKKNRPATLVQVLYTPQKRHEIHHILFSETSSLGIRFYSVQRYALKRSTCQVQTEWGLIEGKCTKIDDLTYFQPEFEQCRQIAKQHHMPIRYVYQKAQKSFSEDETSES